MLHIQRALGVALLSLVALAAPAFGQSLTFSQSERNYHRFFEDFDDFQAARWIVTTTEAGAGDATEAVADADGGILVLTNDAADNDLDFLQWSGVDASTAKETFTFTPGKALLIQSRFKVSDATQSDFIIGLQIIDTTALAVSDGIWFQKDDGDALLDAHVAVGSVQTDATGIATVVSDTYMTVAAYYNGSDASIKLYVNGATVGEMAITNAPTTELTVSMGIQNGEAVAKTMSVDYIGVWKAR